MQILSDLPPSHPTHYRRLLSIAALFALGTIASRAADSVPAGWFVWPLETPASGSALDASALNSAPAGAHGRIRVEDGHFVTGDGHRIRFWGANLAGSDAFVSAKRADELAELFARNGINIVRLHHLDNPWDVKNGGSIWSKDRNDHLQIDPAQLDKIHRLVAALKARGIYVDVNLKVSKTLVPADGFPATVTQFPDFQKRIDMVDRRMIELQKLYAREFLTPKNPYTGYSLADDPAVAMVETNNENSLLGYWTRDLGRGLDTYPQPFRGEIQGLWNAWLARHYPTDAALAAAWKPAATGGSEVLSPSATWTRHLEAESRAEILPGSNGSELNVKVMKTTGMDWHVQVSTGGLKLSDGQVYTVEFDARADKDRKIQVSVSVDPATKEAWRSFGAMQTLPLTTTWTHERIVFPAHGAGTSPGALSFNLGQATGQVSLRHLRFFAGCSGAGLQSGQSARAGTVPLPTSPSPRQWADWISFLADTERAYADEMRSYLRDDLHVKAPITITQIEYGGIEGLWREQGSDFADSHAYWQHPSFPGGDGWDLANWAIKNTPQLDALSDRSFGEFGSLAMNRVAGKPLTVSEYDHPFPSDYECEMYPTFAAFAARQDWDGLFPFAIGDVSTKDATGAIASFFDQQHNPAKWGLSRFATLVFREGLIPAATASAELRVGTPPWAEAYHEDTLWDRLMPAGPIHFLDTRLSVSDRFLPVGERDRIEREGVPAAGPVRIATGPSGKLFLIATPRAAAVVGFIGGTRQAAGSLEVDCPAFGRNFASVTAVALDGRPLPESTRILVTLVARVANQGMVWNAERTTVGRHWGHGPTIAERVPATLSLACSGPRQVFALAPDGTRAKPVPAVYQKGRLTFSDSPDDHTIDYEIVTP